MPCFEAHARRIWEQQKVQERCKDILAQVHAEAANIELPDDLASRVEELFDQNDTLSWDQAIAKVMKEDADSPR